MHALRYRLVTRRLLVHQPDDVIEFAREVGAHLLQVRGLRDDEEETGDVDVRERDESFSTRSHFDGSATPVRTRLTWRLMSVTMNARRRCFTSAIATAHEHQVPATRHETVLTNHPCNKYMKAA